MLPPSQQQSHHCGIETVDGVGDDLLRFGSNRTIVGLKPDIDADARDKRNSSNRTIVGLKRWRIDEDFQPDLSSNRTIVGLKPSLAKRAIM